LNIRVLYNAGLNVLAGVSSALFSVAVPMLLAPRLTPVALVIWSIIMMPAAYTAVFTLGIQSVVARRVAVARAEGELSMLHATVAAALRLMTIAALLYLALLGLATALLGQIYPAIPDELSADAKMAFLAFGAGQATLIPTAAVVGYFYGLQDNAPVAANVVIARLLMAAGIYGASTSMSLTAMSVTATLVLVVANAILFIWYERARRLTMAPIRSRGMEPAHRTEMVSLARECVPVSVWAIATFLIYGGTSSVASVLAFESFAAYSIAVGISLMLLGLHSAAFSTLIPYVAEAQKVEGRAALSRILDMATILSLVLSCSALLLVALIGHEVLALLLPTMGSHDVMSYLVPLLVGNAVRLVGLPYSNALMGLGLQAKILATPWVEAGVTLLASIGLGLTFGAMGVAWSLACGGLASVAMHAALNVRATADHLPISALRLLIIPVVTVLTVTGLALALVHA
jgi:O-antigen/teichoic acid export membrane protein